MSNLQISAEADIDIPTDSNSSEILKELCKFEKHHDTLCHRFREIVDTAAKGEKTMLKYWKGLLCMRHENDNYYRPTHMKKTMGRPIKRFRYEYGADLFNWKPDRGIEFFIQEGFLGKHPKCIASFLIEGKSLSKRMIGEYLGNSQNAWNLSVSECFLQELNFFGMQVDVALRKFLKHLQLPEDMEKMETLLEVFSHRYTQCNPVFVSKLQAIDTIFVLAFAIVVLNMNLHVMNSKEPKQKQKIEDFIGNLSGIDCGDDIDQNMITEIYQRVHAKELKSDPDRVSESEEILTTIKNITMDFAIPERRYVGSYTLNEICNINKKQKTDKHLRKIFVFNDTLLITKPLREKKKKLAYKLKQICPLENMIVEPLEAQYYKYLIKLDPGSNQTEAMNFNALNGFEYELILQCLEKTIRDNQVVASLKNNTKQTSDIETEKYSLDVFPLEQRRSPDLESEKSSTHVDSTDEISNE